MSQDDVTFFFFFLSLVRKESNFERMTPRDSRKQPSKSCRIYSRETMASRTVSVEMTCCWLAVCGAWTNENGRRQGR